LAARHVGKDRAAGAHSLRRSAAAEVAVAPGSHLATRPRVDEGRALWRAVQTHLSEARTALQSGDRAAALAAADAAVAIDPECAAANSLRDQILQTGLSRDRPGTDPSQDLPELSQELPQFLRTPGSSPPLVSV